ncbi:4-hydroxybenzoate octaprenyltransferase [Ignatzschineria indica]|uniref:4-hydroxybenzoate octaprenyltransferase n=1 Tax=Ignatzschineria TaxID=112008 RepID=UPI000B98120C|nr:MULTISPECIES: 4-hydroxybenzoate octaprenyltransferase [Ignatzschineria]MDM1546054.1 4-hydroxybenzoate octaprenyltransferase [Ignatzschineria indica]OYQ77928.1 4-hydroxybenzoate polyprenyltransferase [Ignatzschineria sp. F8392]
MLKIQNIPYYLQLMRVEKPIGSYLLMWPTLWGIWIASEGLPSAKVLIIFMLGVFIMRSAGCVINDIADRDIDKFVERTKDRPLTSGKVTTKEAVSLLLLLIVIAAILALFLSFKTILLSVPALLIALSYPFMKRFHSLPQAHLGVAFAFGIPMAFMEIQGSLPLTAYLLFFTNILWTLIYDTEYAMSDREDDKSINIKSSALLFESWLGKKDYYIIIALQTAMTLLLLSICTIENLTPYFLLSILIVIGLFYYQIKLIKDHDRLLCFKAFIHNNWVGLTLFIGIFLNYLP